MTIVLAIVLGALFGFVLHKVHATDPQRIIGMLRLRDLHLMKVILFAIGVASIGAFALGGAGVFDVGHFSVKGSHVGVIIGGLLFGLGFAIAGYCPGTSVCAIGAGRRDAAVFVVGGLLGALLFTLVYAALAGTWVMADLGGKLSVAETGDGNPALITALPGWVVAGAIGALLMAIAWLLPAGPDARQDAPAVAGQAPTRRARPVGERPA